MPMCDTVDVRPYGSKNVRPHDHGRTRKKPGPIAKRLAKAKDWLEGKSTERGQPEPTRRPTSESIYSGANHQARFPNQSMSGPLYIPKYKPVSYQEPPKTHTASSSHSDFREPEGYHIRPPPPGSYQDDDTGPSPKNLLMAVMGVKSAVNHFAKILISDMNKYPVELDTLKETILSEVNSQVDRANHWKFLVQAYICKRLFEGFDTPNGFFGIESFAEYRMTSLISFADFSKFKDKAATISMLLSTDSEDPSFLGRFCFQKFQSISGEGSTNQPLLLYKEEWDTVESQRHPKSVFYQSFLKVAVSVWLLHRLVHSFEQKMEMLTYPRGAKFQRKNMESVVPGSYEEEDEENDVNTEVGFSVIPGFQVSRSVVKCEVYLRNKNSRPTDIMETAAATDKMPVKTLSHKTPVKTKTPAGRLHSPAETMPSSDPSPEGFRSSSNYGDHGTTTTSADKEVAYRRSLKSGNQETGSRSGRKSRNEQDTVTGGPGVVDRHDRAVTTQEIGGRKSRNEQDTVTGGGPGDRHDRAVTTHFIAAPPMSSSTHRGPHYAARPTKTSEIRRLSNARQSPSG